MVAEVLSQQPPAMQAYLLKTSILNRFSAPLCQVVCAAATKAGADEVSGKEFKDDTDSQVNGGAENERISESYNSITPALATEAPKTSRNRDRA